MTQLEKTGLYKKRCRATAAHGTAAEEEAVALYWLRTGDDASTMGDDASTSSMLADGLERITNLLRLEAAGLSDCGSCCGCIRGSGCSRASNRTCATQGKRGARWAEEGAGLIGRQFEVCCRHFVHLDAAKLHLSYRMYANACMQQI
jgi:hypothetical protein